MVKNDASVQSQAASLHNLEIQMGQLATYLNNRSDGALSSDTEFSRRDDKEQCKALTL